MQMRDFLSRNGGSRKGCLKKVLFIKVTVAGIAYLPMEASKPEETP